MEDTEPMASTELTALRNQLMAKPFLTDDLEKVEEAIARRHQALLHVRDPNKPWKDENRSPIRALVVAGNFRTGKTRAVREGISRVNELPLSDGGTLPSRPLRVNAPEHFTIEALGRAMLDEMKLLPARALGPSRTIERLHAYIPVSEVWRRRGGRMSAINPLLRSHGLRPSFEPSLLRFTFCPRQLVDPIYPPPAS